MSHNMYLKPTANSASTNSLDIILNESMPKAEYYLSLRSVPKSASSYYANDSTRTFKSTKENAVPVFKPCGESVSCTVIMLEGTEKQYVIDKASFGQQLFDQVCDSMSLTEREYFALSFRTLAKVSQWLALDKRISKQIGKGKWNFEILVKYYPYDINNIVDDLTRYYLCLQVRQDIINGNLRCTFWTYVLLGAYVVQSEAGDYDPDRHIGIEYIQEQPFAPLPLQSKEMLERIVEMHKCHKGLAPEEADECFLSNAVKLALYGVDFHRVMDHNKEELEVGVYHSGILLYRGYIRLKHISWVRIIKLGYRNKEFLLTIRPIENAGSKQYIQLVFKCRTSELSQRLYHTCQDHHRFFRLREEYPIKKPIIPPRRVQVISVPTTPSKELERSERPTPMVGVPRQKPQRKRTDLDSDIRPRRPPRPTFPHDTWAMSVPDSTLGLGINDIGLDLASEPDAGWQGVRCNRGIKGPGNYYFEGTVIEDGPILLGWAQQSAKLEPIGSDAAAWALGLLPKSKKSSRRCVVYHNGKKIHSNNSTSTETNRMPHLRVMDTIGCLLKYPLQGDITLQWTINGRPVLQEDNVVKVPDSLRRETLFPAASMLDSRVEVNFGDDAFRYPPSGNSGGCIALTQASEDCVANNLIRGWRMNPYDTTEAIDISPNGLMVQSHLDSGWQGVRANKGVFGLGKYYFEAYPRESGPGVRCRVGWCSEQGSLDLGSDRFGFGYGADKDGFGLSGKQGKKLHNYEINNYGEAYDKDDVVGCYIDLSNGTVQWAKNGREFGTAFKIPRDFLNTKEAFFPCASLKDTTLEFNFGEKPFKHPPKQENRVIPVGFSPKPNTRETTRRGPELSSRYIANELVDSSRSNSQQKRPDWPRFSSSTSSSHGFNSTAHSDTSTASRKIKPTIKGSDQTERSEDLLQPAQPKPNKFYLNNVALDDTDDEAFNDAICNVTGFNPHIRVMVDCVAFVSPSARIINKNFSKALIESDI